MDKEVVWFWIKAALTVTIIIALGIWGFGQYMKFFYMAQLLRGPCQLCVDLNPEVGGCWEMSKRLPAAEKEYIKKFENPNWSLFNERIITNYSVEIEASPTSR